MDTIVIVNEATDLKSTIPEAIFNLDIEGAYHHVDWNFLLEAIEIIGHG